MPASQSPFHPTHCVTALVAHLAKRLDAWKLANALSLEHVIAMPTVKPVLGSPKEIQKGPNVFAPDETIGRGQLKMSVQSDGRFRYLVSTIGGRWHVL